MNWPIPACKRVDGTRDDSFSSPLASSCLGDSLRAALTHRANHSGRQTPRVVHFTVRRPERPKQSPSNANLNMHEFACNCDSMIVVVPPSQNAGYVVWDCDVDLSIDSRRKEIHGFLMAIASGRREAWLRNFYGSSDPGARLSHKTDTDVIEDIMSKHDRYTRICYRCPNCGRIFIEMEPWSGRYQAYAVDDN